jgi:hypothetical protein
MAAVAEFRKNARRDEGDENGMVKALSRISSLKKLRGEGTRPLAGAAAGFPVVRS